MKKLKIFNRRLSFAAIGSILILSIICCSTSIQTQTKFGVKAGVSTFGSNVSMYKFSQDGIRYTADIHFIGNTNKKSIGVFWVKDFDFLFLQVDALYGAYQSQFLVDLLSQNRDNGTLDYFDVKVVDLSILAGYNFGSFDIGVGPVFHNRIEVATSFSEYDFFEEKGKRLSAGFQLSAAYTKGPFRFQVKCEDYFSKPGEFLGFTNGAKNKFSKRLHAFSFEVGMGF